MDRPDKPWEWSPEVRHQFNNTLRDLKRIDDPRLAHKLEDDLMALMHATTKVVDGVIARAIASTL